MRKSSILRRKGNTREKSRNHGESHELPLVCQEPQTEATSILTCETISFLYKQYIVLELSKKKKKERIGLQHIETETKSNNNNNKSEMMLGSLTPEFKSVL